MLVLWSAWNAHLSRRHRRWRFRIETLLSRNKDLRMWGIAAYGVFTYRLIWEYKYTLFDLWKWYENIKQERTWLQSPTLRISQVYGRSKTTFQNCKYSLKWSPTRTFTTCPSLFGQNVETSTAFAIYYTKHCFILALSVCVCVCVYAFEDWN